MRFCFIACGLLALSAATAAAPPPEPPRAAPVVRAGPLAGRLMRQIRLAGEAGVLYLRTRPSP